MTFWKNFFNKFLLVLAFGGLIFLPLSKCGADSSTLRQKTVSPGKASAEGKTSGKATAGKAIASTLPFASRAKVEAPVHQQGRADVGCRQWRRAGKTERGQRLRKRPSRRPETASLPQTVEMPPQGAEVGEGEDLPIQKVSFSLPMTASAELPRAEGTPQEEERGNDAKGETGAADKSISQAVVAPLRVISLEKNRKGPQIVGAPITWKAGVKGGKGKRTFKFILRSAGGKGREIQAGSSSKWNWSPKVAGHYQVRVMVEDGRGDTAVSPWSAPAVIVAQPMVELIHPRNPFPRAVGTPLIGWKVKAVVHQGIKLTYAFHVRRNGRETVVQTGASSVLKWTPSRAGRYRIEVAALKAGEVIAESGWSQPFQISKYLIAVLPLDNLSGQSAPLANLRKELIKRLKKEGMTVVGEDELRDFMARHRLRYTGGIGRGVAVAFQKAGVSRVLISSLTNYRRSYPPLFGLACRLVTTGLNPAITWADSADLAGDDKAGLLGLDLVNKIGPLRDRALRRIVQSLSAHLAGRKEMERAEDSRFRPKVQYRAPGLKFKRPTTVAILPFVNQSDRPFAGDLIALDFLQALTRNGTFKVLEPGVLRQQLLHVRMILPHGASLDTANILFGELHVDLLLSGLVREYDQDATGGAPRTYFTVQAVRRKDLKMIWSSQSSSAGNDGVWFFDYGRVGNVNVLASRMVREVVRNLAPSRK